MRRAAGESRERLARFWDRSRDYYEQAAEANAVPSPDRDRLLSYLKGGERVLDLGSGSCENAQWVPASCHYFGTDLSTVALRMAGEADRPGIRLRADAAALPLASETFDAVLSTYALEHFHDPGTTFLEVARVLRPGGLLLIVGSAWDLPYEMPPSVEPTRRLEIALRRSFRHLGVLWGQRTSFDIVREPRVLRQGYIPDADAVYAVQSTLLVGFLKAVGFEVVEHLTLPHGADPRGLRGLLRRILRQVPLWRHGWGNTLIVARRRAQWQLARFRLRYL